MYAFTPGGLFISFRPWQSMHLSFSGIDAVFADVGIMKVVSTIHTVIVSTYMASTPSSGLRLFEALPEILLRSL
jgi:hypothetical protein